MVNERKERFFLWRKCRQGAAVEEDRRLVTTEGTESTEKESYIAEGAWKAVPRYAWNEVIAEKGT
jgi:hypothetical protein